MLFVKLLIVAYLIVSALAVLMVLSAIDSKGFRVAFIILGFGMPLIFLYSAVASFFSPKPVPRFNEEVAGVEDDIEAERIKLFGGERTCPSFSEHWKNMYQVYLEKVFQRAARTSEKIVSIGGALHNGSRAA